MRQSILEVVGLNQLTLDGPDVSRMAYREFEFSGRGNTYRKIARDIIERWPELIDKMRGLGWERFSLDFTANEVAELALRLRLADNRESVRKMVWPVAEKTGRVKKCNVTGRPAQTFRWPNGGRS